jgi:hypothetical protein
MKVSIFVIPEDLKESKLHPSMQAKKLEGDRKSSVSDYQRPTHNSCNIGKFVPSSYHFLNFPLNWKNTLTKYVVRIAWWPLGDSQKFIAKNV